MEKVESHFAFPWEKKNKNPSSLQNIESLKLTSVTVFV